MAFTLAILGAGGWGWNWTERALANPDVDVLAFADANPHVLTRLAERGVMRNRLFSSAEAAMAACLTDAVTVSLPNPARVPLLHRALEEARHILVDKPLVHTAGAASRLLAEAALREGVFMVAQNYRFCEVTRLAKQAIQSGATGPVGGMHVHFLRELRHSPPHYHLTLPGAIPLGFEMCVHHFDMMRFLLGADPETVTAQGWRSPWSPGIGYDALDVHLTFPGGVEVAYDATWGATHVSTDWPGHWEIIGQEQTLSFGHEGRAWRVYDVEGREVAARPGLGTDEDTRNSMDRVWTEFQNAMARVEAGEPAPGLGFCPIEDNIHTLGICLAVEESIETRSPVDFGPFLRSKVIAARDVG
ncbi:MAG TPA: Gfo/Idh/MocA family oxidoreductase [Armatimonadota bacterium]|jgi:predicted dehydrogenase